MTGLSCPHLLHTKCFKNKWTLPSNTCHIFDDLAEINGSPCVRLDKFFWLPNKQSDKYFILLYILYFIIILRHGVCQHAELHSIIVGYAVWSCEHHVTYPCWSLAICVLWSAPCNQWNCPSSSHALQQSCRICIWCASNRKAMYCLWKFHPLSQSVLSIPFAYGSIIVRRLDGIVITSQLNSRRLPCIHRWYRRRDQTLASCLLHSALIIIIIIKAGRIITNNTCIYILYI